jgi:hypothetical protein
VTTTHPGPAHRHACRLLMLAALFHAGCGERREQVGSVAEPATSPMAATSAPTSSPVSTASAVPRAVSGVPIGVVRAFVAAPRETSLTPPEAPPPEPTAHYASLEAARDAIEAMLRHAVPAGDTAIHFSREAVPFEYIWARAAGRGLAVHVIVNDTTACPHDKLMDAMRAAGWVDNWHYSADGDDGTQMGLVCRQFLCVINGSWIGFDPTDTTYVPPPGCKVTATVAPRRDDDTPDR